MRFVIRKISAKNSLGPVHSSTLLVFLLNQTILKRIFVWIFCKQIKKVLQKYRKRNNWRLFFLTIGNNYFSIILLILRTECLAIIHDLPPYFNNSYSGQIEIISTLNSVCNSIYLQNVKHSYPIIKFLQLDCNFPAASRTWIENLLPSPKRDGFGGQHHHRCDYFSKPSGPIILRCFWDNQ